MSTRTFRYVRRHNWSREEWIIAYDACPKDLQSYGPESSFVREVADLLGRTPAAVSRAFGNLWAAQTGGRHGLIHRSHVADEVVSEFRDDLPRLHSIAQALRLERIPRSLTPRLELQSSTETAPLDESVVNNVAHQSGLASGFYFVTTRPGSTVVDVGILLDVLLIGVTGWDAVLRMVQGMRERAEARQRASPHEVVLLRSTTWREIERGRTSEVEEGIFAAYLPGFSAGQLPRESRSRLAGFLSFLRGVRRRPVDRRPNGPEPKAATVGRPFTRATLERILGMDLSALPDSSVKQLSDLVKVVRTNEFTSALKSARRAARRRRRTS